MKARYYIHYAIEYKGRDFFKWMSLKTIHFFAKENNACFDFINWENYYGNHDKNLTKAQRKELEHSYRHYLWSSQLHEPKDYDELPFGTNY